jgi:hypothetical protein
LGSSVVHGRFRASAPSVWDGIYRKFGSPHSLDY